MPGTTAHGYPYAQPADPLVQWPATSQQLAEKIESAPRVAYGFGQTDAAGSARVTFPVGMFTTPPRVTVSFVSDAGAEVTGGWVLQIGQKTAAGCTVYCSIPGTGFKSAFFDWIAVGT